MTLQMIATRAEHHSVSATHSLAGAAVVPGCSQLLTGLHGLPWVALVAASLAAGYGAWRFWRAYRLTRCRLSLIAAAVSLSAPLSVVVLASFDDGSSSIQAGLPAVGVVAAAGFGLSRTRWLAPMTLGLWLSPAIEHWRRGYADPLARLLETVLGQPAAGHASRTAALADSLAEPLSVPPQEADDLVLAALLHAIGSPLGGHGTRACPPSPEASSLAAGLLQQLPGCHRAAATIAAFSERWDGSGPLALSGESLPVAARIIAVAEAFDHASEGGLASARAAIREGSGAAFDPIVVSELLHLYRERSTPATA